MSVPWTSLWTSRLEVRNHYDLGLQVTDPLAVELGSPPKILVTVSTGRNAVERLKLCLACPNTTWSYFEAQAQGNKTWNVPLGYLSTDRRPLYLDEGLELEKEKDGLILRSLDEDKEYSLVLPHSGSSSMHDLVGPGLRTLKMTIWYSPHAKHFRKSVSKQNM